MKNNKKILAISIMIIAIIIISILGTYAYFLAGIGETVNERLIVKAGTMQLVFRDTDELVTNTEATLNFGDIITKEFEIENTGTLTAYAKISWDNLVNTYLEESLSYTLEYKSSLNDNWEKIKTTWENVPRSETSSKKELANRLEIPSQTTYTYRLTIKLEDLEDIDQTQDLKATLSTKFTLDEGDGPITSESVLKDLNLQAKEKNRIPNFSKISTTDETRDGLYAMEDDYGTSYYFRGAVENNYIKFGQNKDGQEMWWRIIRINGDGSLRILYDGTQGWTNGVADENRLAMIDVPWNTNWNDAKYVGWMYGNNANVASSSYEEAVKNETNSNIKNTVETWYEENILNTGYSKYINDSIFCNDRSIPGKDSTGWELDTGLGYKDKATVYGAGGRILQMKTDAFQSKDSPIPKFSCNQKNDAFTKNETEKSNGASKYPIGFITADEIIAAGAKYQTVNKNYYLFKGTWYWSFSPSFMGSNVYAYEFYVNTEGQLNSQYSVKNAQGMVPVINLNPIITKQIIGNGTIDNPYQIQEQ